jgi:hypothetical protein
MQQIGLSFRSRMPLEPLSPAAFAFVAQVEQNCTTLLRSAPPGAAGLGGQLLYAGELDESGRALIVAANVAGAATLAASADLALSRRAMRDGIVDFLVNSLDEALRILKNQVRKREAVAVCVSSPSAAVEAEMRARGVQPDLLRSTLPTAPLQPELLYRESDLDESDLSKIPALVVWRVDSVLPKDLALLDEIAVGCLDAGEESARRWLRLAPRYLGRLAQGLRLLSAHREFLARFSEQLRARADRGEITFPYEIRSYVRGIENKQTFDPKTS